MREQVAAASPPSAERRRASIHPGGKELAFQFGRSDGRKFVFCKSPEKTRDGGDQRVERRENSSVGEQEEEGEDQKMKEEEEEAEMESGEEGSAVAGGEREEKYVERTGNADGAEDGVAMVLHWGHRKRPRCSRADNGHYNHGATNKHSNVTDESSSKKPSRSSKGGPSSIVIAGSRSSAAMAAVQVKSSNGGNKESAAAAEERRRRVKTLRGAAMVYNPVQSKHREEIRKSSTEQKQKKSATVVSGEKALLSASATISIANGPALKMQKKLDWPKILICLSRKEKEDDFLIFKGSKLPQRPKRRSKTVEKLLHYCTPGNWLADLSHGRYDVIEKKCVKKKPRGLKAMESMDSDSD